MTQILENSRMSKDFFRCRPQIVRLCRSLTEDADAAEDLAQETLVEVWRGQALPPDPDAARAWIFGIARNVCRRHFRRQALARERQAQEAAMAGEAWETCARQEQAAFEQRALLDQALNSLPEAAQALLTARYCDDWTLAEIAAQMHCSENTAAVRLGRARGALRTVLSTRLRTETAALGLLLDTPCWRPTRVWCFRCGAKRLEERREPGARFSIRCPGCDGTGSDVAFSTRHAAMDPVQVLGQVQSCKPALRRINAWWDARLQRSLSTGVLSCWRCAAQMTRTAGAGDGRPHRASFSCGRCGAEFSLPASGLAFHSEAVQEFWQRHPRLRVRPERRIEIGRKPAIVTRYEAVGSAAAIESVYDAQTFCLLGQQP